MTSLQAACKKSLKNSMGLKKKETVLIVTDTTNRKIGVAFFEAAREISSEAIFMEITPLKINGQEPPQVVAQAMKTADVVMITTTKSITHTIATKKARTSGTRIASMPDITEDIIKRTLSADYNKIEKRSKKLANILEKGSIIRVLTKAGTDITMIISHRQAHGTSEGFIKKKGKLGNLPAGEACVSPREATANGLYVIDSTSPLGGKVDKPIKIIVEKGFATKISGGKAATELKKQLKSLKNKNVYNIAEIGIGTNDKAKLTGNVLEDEKVLGTAHIALGDNFGIFFTVDIFSTKNSCFL